MKQIVLKRETNSYERKEFIKNVIATNPKRYKVFVDLRNGSIKLFNTTKSRCYLEIGEIDFRNPQNTNKYIQQKGSELYKLIKDYNSTCLRCKTTIKKKYGVEGLIDKSFVVSVPNPYYKCSYDMELYDENVIQYYLKKNVA